MPKKRASIYATKPSSPAHSSLTSSGKPKDGSHSLVSSVNPTGSSVNDRIQQLRISQGQNSRSSTEILNAGTSPTLPPSLRNILQLPDTPPPRPRPGLRVTGRVRGPAGPVPPSWLGRRDNGPGSPARLRAPKYNGERAKFESLPGSFLAEEESLVAITLKTLAKNWEWHAQYDQYYLATIPVRYKEALLHYIAYYGTHGMNKADLELLFLDETELEDAIGAEGLTHLDLSTFIGNSLSLRELRDLFRAEKARLPANEESDAVPESWDAPDMTAQPSALPRFHTLTHLSLSHPNTTASWKGLLDLAPHLKTLTHLSLAYWPTPTLSPNSTTAYRETPQGNVNYGASNFYSAYDNDWSEAAAILRRLGKSTICLKWIDLTGCYPWVQALGYEQIDWFGGWQGLETIKVSQGWMPDCFKNASDKLAWKSIYRLPPGHTEIEQRSQLIDWAQIEWKTIQLETTVETRLNRAKQESDNSGIDQLRQERQAMDYHWDRDGRQQLPIDRPALGYRSNRGYSKVTFDRGWDAWWIADAIDDVADRTN